MSLDRPSAFGLDAIGVGLRQTDLDELRTYLDQCGEPRFQYVAVLAVVASTVRHLIKKHEACTTAHCMTCWELRYARAALGALEFNTCDFRILREVTR